MIHVPRTHQVAQALRWHSCCGGPNRVPHPHALAPPPAPVAATVPALAVAPPPAPDADVPAVPAVLAPKAPQVPPH